MKSNYLVTILFFILYQTVIFSHVCNESLTPDPSEYGYRQRGEGNSYRCEGFYQSPVCGNNLKIARLIAGSFNYALNSGNSIKICTSFPCSVPVKITSEALNQNTYYSMDALLMPNDTLFWPVQDVLLPNQLTNDRIGLYGTIQSNDTEKYIPLKIDHSGIGNTQLIFLHVQALTNLTEVGWSYNEIVNGRVVRQSGDLKAPNLSYHAYEIIKICLPDTQADELIIEVFGKWANENRYESMQYNVILN